MTTYQLTPETFLKDVADHQMQIIHEAGVYRHLRFHQPGTVCMHFDIITWPGRLCYTGDMGTFVFSRVHDMLEFFRPSDYAKVDPLNRIDRRYWAEKIDAQDRADGVKEFSEEKFSTAVMERLVEWIRNNRSKTSKEERRELWESVVQDVLGAEEDSGGYRKQCAAHDFIHWIRPEMSFSFQDFWEANVQEYTHRFLWCCYALRWAVMKYDEAKAPAPEFLTEDPDHAPEAVGA